MPLLQLLQLLLLKVLPLLLPPDVLLDDLAVFEQVPGGRQQGRPIELHAWGLPPRTASAGASTAVACLPSKSLKRDPGMR